MPNAADEPDPNSEVVITWLFRAPKTIPSWWEVVLWWELRRIPYNVIVAILGIIGWLSLFWLLNLANELKPGDDVMEPVLIIVLVPLINILYTFGWMFELFCRLFDKKTELNAGPILFGMGVAFSACVIFFPSVLWCLTLIHRAFFG